MTKDQRRERAKLAAEARWSSGVLRAAYVGELNLAGRMIGCAVLEDGRRVLSQQSFLAAIGRRGNPNDGGLQEDNGDFSKTPPFLAADNLKPFITQDLAASSSPILYRLQTGGRFHGYLGVDKTRDTEHGGRAMDTMNWIAWQAENVRLLDKLCAAGIEVRTFDGWKEVGKWVKKGERQRAYRVQAGSRRIGIDPVTGDDVYVPVIKTAYGFGADQVR